MKELYKNQTGLDALFEHTWSENAVIHLRTDKLYPFARHPFKVLDEKFGYNGQTVYEEVKAMLKA